VVNVWEEKAEKLRGKKVHARIECSTNANVTGEDDEENWEDNNDGPVEEKERTRKRRMFGKF
jgi:hypothetical protein